eukprot:403262-Pyramimonas_sp.AAC.1
MDQSDAGRTGIFSRWTNQMLSNGSATTNEPSRPQREETPPPRHTSGCIRVVWSRVKGVVWSSDDAESGPQHRLQTANRVVH